MVSLTYSKPPGDVQGPAGRPDMHDTCTVGHLPPLLIRITLPMCFLTEGPREELTQAITKANLDTPCQGAISSGSYSVGNSGQPNSLGFQGHPVVSISQIRTWSVGKDTPEFALSSMGPIWDSNEGHLWHPFPDAPSREHGSHG